MHGFVEGNFICNRRRKWASTSRIYRENASSTSHVADDVEHKQSPNVAAG